MGQLFLFTLLLFQDPSIDQAGQLLRDGDFYGAEGLLLSLEPAEDQIIPIGEMLTGIAYVIAAQPEQLDRKYTFYQGYLSRSRTWRGVSLFVLSAISAKRGQWADLENYGGLLLSDYQTAVYPVKYRLLYQLARHTSLDGNSLNLGELELAWFQTCRKTDPDLLAPVDVDSGMPFFLRHLHLLSTDQPFEIPALPEPGLEEDEYLIALLKIRKKLAAEDLVATSKLINGLTPLDRSLARPDLRVHYYPLMQDFFEMWGKPERAERLEKNLTVARDRTVFGIRVVPERAREVASQPVKVKPPEVEVPEPEPETEPPETEPDSQTGPKTFGDLEKRILSDHRGMELSIRGKEPNTTFKKAYKNYLFGLYYLKAGRLDRSWEHLYLAERLARDYPFPNLETKILMTMADYYEAKDNPDDAKWRRIEAAQLWNTPEHIPVFMESRVPAPSPYRALIEAALENPGDSQNAHSLLYYAESAHFRDLRQLAYQRNALASKAVIGNQIQQVGRQLNRLIRSLAEDPRHSSDPERYNTTLDLWNSLWKQVQPYYRESSIPSLSDIQKTLENRNRVLVFLEGYRRIGVLVISQQQAFVVGLGSRSNFTGLSEKEQFDYLEGRLGPIWQQNGKLMIMLSETFENESFIKNLRERMSNPANARLLFSLKALASPKQIRECRRIVVASPSEESDLGGMIASMPQSRLTWLDQTRATSDNLTRQLKDSEQIILAGKLELGDQGLIFQTRGGEFPLHQIVHQSSNLCNLTLITDFDSWVAAMPELELVNPDGTASIYILSDPDQMKSMRGKRFGLFFP